MTTRQRLDGPALHRAATIDGVDDETRSVNLSFSSEEPYLRSSWFDSPWIEVLGHDPSEVDMSRLTSGMAPVLFGHNASERGAHVGVVDKAWLKDGRGYADIRISKRADADGLWQDIKDGILRSVSVGYQIQERTLTKQNETGPDEYRVTKWLPMEVSLVPVPADATVGIGRSADDPPQRFTVTEQHPEGPHSAGLSHSRTQEMTEQTAPANPAVTEPAAAAPVDLNNVRSEASIAERQRATEILGIATKAGLGEQFAAEHIGANTPLDQVRAKAIDAMAARNVPAYPTMSIGKDQADKTRDAGAAWLLHRSGEKVDAAALNGNDFRGLSLIEMARECIRIDGGSHRGKTSAEIAGMACRSSGSLTTSTFPLILQNVMHKTLQAAYTAQPDAWRRFCAIGNLSDFRAHYRYRPGSFGNLATVTEKNEFTFGTLSDAERESITAGTKGKLLSITRQMIINDDMGAFAGIVRAMGRGAARTIESDVFALLVANPAMGDTGALFNSTAITAAGGHANIASSAAAPTVASFDAARQAMANQKDVGQNDYISVRPAIWLGPVAYGGAARVVNDAQYDVDSTKFQIPNKVRGLLREVIDTPYLTGTAWYLFADPGEEPVVEVGFLNGQQAPYTEMEQGFEVDGITWKVRLDYGVAAVGWRGAHKNAGA